MVSGGELNQMSGGVSGALNSVTEFCDLVPNNYLPSMPTTKVQMVQGKFLYKPFFCLMQFPNGAFFVLQQQ
jgi:hypothetical protein